MMSEPLKETINLTPAPSSSFQTNSSSSSNVNGPTYSIGMKEQPFRKLTIGGMIVEENGGKSSREVVSAPNAHTVITEKNDKTTAEIVGKLASDESRNSINSSSSELSSTTPLQQTGSTSSNLSSPIKAAGTMKDGQPSSSPSTGNNTSLATAGAAPPTTANQGTSTNLNSSSNNGGNVKYVTSSNAYSNSNQLNSHHSNNNNNNNNSSSSNHNHHHQHHHHGNNSNHNNNNNNTNNNNLNAMNRTITLEELRKYFHLPIAEVARQFGTCTTALKKICRRLNVTKWPYRQILSLTKSIQSLEMAALNEGVAQELRQQYRNQISTLQKCIAEVMKNPSKAMETLNMNFEFHPALLDPTKNPLGLEHSLSQQHHDQLQKSLDGVKGSSEDDDIIGNDEVRQMIQAATLSLGKLESANPQQSSSHGNGNNATHTFKRNKSSKRLSDVDLATEEQVKLKRGKSYDDVHYSKMNNNYSQLTVGGTLASNGDNSSRKSNFLSDFADMNGVQNNSSSGQNNNNNNNQSGTLSGPNNLNGQYLMDVGVTSVQCHYNPDQHKYHFNGQVLLAPLHRKKFRPSTLRKVVPLMEPDIGSNFNIDFFPNLTMPN